MSTVDLTNTRQSLRRHLLGGFFIALFLVGGLGSWAAFASLQAAVIAAGKVVVQSNRKQVQHKDGGIVAAIHAKEGDRVQAGAVVVRLDGTQLEAEQGIIRSRIFELTARRWRLSAERDGLSKLQALTAPQLSASNKGDQRFASLVKVQRRLFRSRLETLIGRKGQLRERIVQLRSQVDGLKRVETAGKKQLAILESEITDLIKLKKKHLVSTKRMNTLEREAARVIGEIGQVEANIAKTRGQIAEMQLILLELDERYRTEALSELQTVEGELTQLAEKRNGIEEKLRRLEIRAPVTGRVHEVAVHTVGGIVRPGETLLSVVPDDDDLVLDVMIRPHEIDRVRQGMASRVRFTAFDQRTTPELHGRVAWISPDQTEVTERQEPYFKVRVRLDDNELKRLGGLSISPGMPAEVMITSNERTVMSYLVKPISDQLNRAFRER